MAGTSSSRSEEEQEERIAIGPTSDATLREQSQRGQSCCAQFLVMVSFMVVLATFPLAICLCLKIVQEYERAIIFRLGRALQEAKGPGLFFVLPCTDQFVKVDLRTVSFEVPPQEILTKDSVTVAVDAVVYYRISNPMVSVVNVENAARSTQLLAQTTLRNILGTKTLSEILTDRESISAMMQHVLDDGTDPWGVQVERVEIKDVRLPVQLQRAMATEAEAQREARAKVIAAEGEKKASNALKEAADVINQSANALQLRYLQTLTQISAEKNSTIIFPFPVDILSACMGGNNDDDDDDDGGAGSSRNSSMKEKVIPKISDGKMIKEEVKDIEKEEEVKEEKAETTSSHNQINSIDSKAYTLEKEELTDLGSNPSLVQNVGCIQIIDSNITIADDEEDDEEEEEDDDEKMMMVKKDKPSKNKNGRKKEGDNGGNGGEGGNSNDVFPPPPPSMMM